MNHTATAVFGKRHNTVPADSAAAWLAGQINGCSANSASLPDDIIEYAENNHLVIVYGMCNDEMVMVGCKCESGYADGTTTLWFIGSGRYRFSNGRYYDDRNKRHSRMSESKITGTVTMRHLSADSPCWELDTDIPCAWALLYDGDEPFTRVAVFSIKDACHPSLNKPQQPFDRLAEANKSKLIQAGNVICLKYRDLLGNYGFREETVAIIGTDDSGIDFLRFPVVNPRTGRANVGNISWYRFLGASECDMRDDLREAVSAVAMAVRKKTVYAMKVKAAMNRLDGEIDEAIAAATICESKEKRYE